MSISILNRVVNETYDAETETFETETTTLILKLEKCLHAIDMLRQSMKILSTIPLAAIRIDVL